MTPHRTCPAHESEDALQPWVWSQHWLNVIFLHWQVPAAALRRHLPAELEVDVYQGRAWASLVLFRLRVRPRWLPFLPGLSELLEVNLRTYVRFQGRPGIWFLSVLADNAWAIQAARWLTPMPYAQADIAYRQQANGYHFEACSQARFDERLAVSLLPDPTEQPTVDGSLDAWLLERYCLFISGPRHGLMHAHVAHRRWTFCNIQLVRCFTTLGRPFGLDFSHVPDRIHYAPGIAARFGAFQQVEPVFRNEAAKLRQSAPVLQPVCRGFPDTQETRQ
jgi:uncharacterized protein YqjF (DUF2071 family)